MATDERRLIGSRIRRALGRADVRPGDLAKELGKVGSAVSGWMSGRTQPSLEFLAYICRRTQTSADEILGLKSVAAPEPLYPTELVERVMREAQSLEAAAKQLQRAAAAQKKKR